MRLVSVCLFTLLSMVAVLPVDAGDSIDICHFSPGGTASKAMTVSAESAEWHMRKHGDHIGGCLGAVLPLSVVHVTDSSSNDVIVFNGDSNTQIETLDTKKTPLRVIAAPNREFVYIPNFNSGSARQHRPQELLWAAFVRSLSEEQRTAALALLRIVDDGEAFRLL